MTLELRGVSKRTGAETLIHETSLTLAPEGFNVLLGATNAGKTSLIKMMAGLEKPATGSVWLDGRDVTRLSPQKRNVSLVHQFFINYPNMTVFENIASPLRVAGVDRAEISRRVGETAELLRLGPMLQRRPHELSGGQQQRTALARAIVKDSVLVLLDEPLANLDYKLREELREQLPALFAGRGALVVYATSEPSEALLLGGHTAALHEGRVTQFGPTAECYRAPVDLTTARVFSDPPINAVPVEKRGRELSLANGAHWPASDAMARQPDGPYRLGLRPHFVSARRTRPEQLPMAGEIQITELSGSESVAHFRAAGVTWVSKSDGVQAFAPGDRHEFFLDVSNGLYFTEDGRRVA